MCILWNQIVFSDLEESDNTRNTNPNRIKKRHKTLNDWHYEVQILFSIVQYIAIYLLTYTAQNVQGMFIYIITSFFQIFFVNVKWYQICWLLHLVGFSLAVQHIHIFVVNCGMGQGRSFVCSFMLCIVEGSLVELFQYLNTNTMKGTKCKPRLNMRLTQG